CSSDLDKCRIVDPSFDSKQQTLLLNGVAAWVSLYLKSTSNFVVYLKNLVAADIIMTLIMPIKAARDLQDNAFFWIVSVVLAVSYISIANKVIQSFRNSGSSNNQGQKKIKLPSLTQANGGRGTGTEQNKPLSRQLEQEARKERVFHPEEDWQTPWDCDKTATQRCSEDLKMNNTLSNTSMKCVRDTSVTAVVFPCLYSILFIVALILNSLAAWIFFSIPSSSTFVVFLKNVVVADLLMTLTIPLRVLSDAGVGSLYLRAFHCRYSAVLFYITMYISILLLGLISLDRYLKIVRPFGKCALQRVRVGQLLSAAIWVVMLALALPNVILSDQPPRGPGGRLKCTSMKSNAGMLWHAGFNYFCQVVFWGTLALMVVCYTFISKKVYESYKASKCRSQAASRRTKAKVYVVVGVFFICFAPFHFARVPYTLTQTGSMASHCKAQQALYIAKETTLWLSATNVCLDPLIYVFLCKVFRRRLTSALCRRPFNKGAMESPTATSTQLEMSQMAPSNRLSYNGVPQ
ncbi:hypothetical protein KUCAC02_006002, partial [Chaenocephalus aceratus]